MTKLITIIFLATALWLFMNAMTNVIIALYLHCDKAIKRSLKKRRRKV